MRIRLLTAMKFRLPEGGSRILHPGIYDDEDPNFPEALRDESRPGVVEKLDAPASVPGPSENENSGFESDPDDESNDDIGLKEEETEGTEEEEEEEEEVKKASTIKKKDRIKRRG